MKIGNRAGGRKSRKAVRAIAIIAASTGLAALVGAGIVILGLSAALHQSIRRDAAVPPVQEDLALLQLASEAIQSAFITRFHLGNITYGAETYPLPGFSYRSDDADHHRVLCVTSSKDYNRQRIPIPEIWVASQPFDNYSLVREIHDLILFFHGRTDRVIAWQSTVKLYETANDPKICFWIPGADHSLSRYAESVPTLAEPIRIFLVSAKSTAPR